MKKIIAVMMALTVLLLSACSMQCECSCTCGDANNGGALVQSPPETTEAEVSKFVGTWTCELWYDAQGDANRNAKLVIEADGTAQYKASEEWATYAAKWKEIDENTISVSYTTIYNTIDETEYTYIEADGVCHLVFDNGKVSRDFVKQ